MYIQKFRATRSGTDSVKFLMLNGLSMACRTGTRNAAAGVATRLMVDWQAILK